MKAFFNDANVLVMECETPEENDAVERWMNETNMQWKFNFAVDLRNIKIEFKVK